MSNVTLKEKPKQFVKEVVNDEILEVYAGRFSDKRNSLSGEKLKTSATEKFKKISAQWECV